MVFASVDDATRCWIKGRKFSLAGLLADPTGAAAVAPSPDSTSSKAARSSKASSGAAAPAIGGGAAMPAAGSRAAAPAAGSGAALPAGDSGMAGAADGNDASNGSSNGGNDGSNGDSSSEDKAGAAAAGCPSATAGLAQQFSGGSMAIFRLAPQDYHRCAGRVETWAVA